MKLKHVLFALFGLITLGPLAVLWAWLAFSLMGQEVADAKGRHLLLARSLAANLQHYHGDISSGFALMASNLAAGKTVAMADDIVQKLKFRHICLADAKTGRVRRQISPASALCPATMPADRFAMLTSLASGDGVWFSPVMAGPDGAPLLYVVKPIGRWLAVGALKTDYFVALGKSVSFGEKGHAAIVDQAGNLLAHPMPDWVAARKNIANIPAVARLLKGEAGAEAFHSPASMGEMVAGFAPVAGAGWGVMIRQPMAELRASADVARDSILIVVAAALLGAALLAALVTRPLVRPLNRLVAATGEIEKGNSAARLEVVESWYIPRELRDAQRRFNAMARSVEDYQRIQAERRERAEQANKDKSEYLANLGHELRTPLNSVLGFTNMMRKEPYGPLGSERYHEFLEDIDHGATHLLHLINDLLDLTRVETGMLCLAEDDVGLNETIRRCRSILKQEIENKEIDLSVRVAQDGLRLKADERAVNQIMINLVSNAVRYSGQGGRIEISAETEAGGAAVIRVSDTGCGIPEEDLERVLQPFVRLENPAVSRVQGTGLGLSIVAKLAEAHGVELGIDSALGEGTTVSLRFPPERVSERAISAAA